MLNTVHCEDNLSLIKRIKSEYIDLIYCDVLYNTGQKFDDFNDDLGTVDEAIEWYRPRFVEMRRTLKNTGNVYIHCDYRLSHYLKILMDEIFGIEQFRNEIIWYYNSAPRRKNSFSSRHDTILRYSKTNNFYFDDSKIREPYSKTAPRGYEKEKYYDPLGKVMGDVWQINILGQNDKRERINYATQKPKELLYPIIVSSSKEGDLVADFFCGSGTTGVVAKQNRRNYLLCDINPKAVEITQNRLINTCKRLF